ncbi:MAG: hypothetical protein A2452_03325 [Candidatus Firestonebacteria bacterium RIFOXYC2_FULL_39_67]|nr:MAG: hypothetical protein A2536_02740 [Candidatus Firestonebacteria bacterium RIFOXYD2_FULL_39_29]OGF55299.1 MAG: hypothetical protein A2452_03325 [Candidatus Firestonebacteria bacterium RIFOXYC2_FULL_39_67]
MTNKPSFKKFTFFRRLYRVLRKKMYLLSEAAGSFLFLFLNGKPGVFSKEEIKKILLIRLDRVGDLILTTPALKAIRDSYPAAKIDILVRRYTKELLFGNKNIDAVIEYESFSSRQECEMFLRKNNYDAALVFHPGYQFNRLAYMSGAKWRAGYSGSGGSFFLNLILKDDRDVRIRHEVISALEVAAKIGVMQEQSLPEVKVSPENKVVAQDFLKKNKIKGKFAVVHPGSRQEYIRWSKEEYSKVAKWLIDTRKMKVVLTAGKDEYGYVLETAFMVKEGAVIADGLTLGVLTALISLSEVFVGNSTGPMHIAAALKVPTVAIFGNAHPLDSYKVWGPLSQNSKAVFSELNCEGCHPGDCRSFECKELITTETVKAAIEEVLGKGER